MSGFNQTRFYPGFDIVPTADPMGFEFGPGVFGPSPEYRKLDAIRASLLDPGCTGPDPVYAIVMDVGKQEHLPLLNQLRLLYGAVTYAAGRLGAEPVRSQGHIHKQDPVTGWSTPEVYEIWSGKAVILMQESASDDPGRCFAVTAAPGEVVVVPPGWAHATISADPSCPLTFGAWCIRDYGFVYDEVRSHKGLAWYPLLNADNALTWIRNMNYRSTELTVKSPEGYSRLGILRDVPIYSQFEAEQGRFRFITEPHLFESAWKNFIP